MNDLISRKALIERIRPMVGLWDEGDFWISYERVLDIIDQFPSAEPERKKGKWNFIGDNMFKCSCCGVLYTTHQLNGLRNYDTDPYAPYFCPNCGADMRGEE